MPVATPRQATAESWRQTTEPLLYAAIFLSIAGVLLADIYTPLGVAVWVIYLLPIGLSLWVWRPQIPIIVAAVCTLLMIVTFMTDAPGVDRTTAQMNRAFGVFTIWSMAIVGYFFIKNKLAIHTERWIQLGQTDLSRRMIGDQRLEQLGDNLVGFLADYVGATVALCYARDGARFQRIGAYGVPSQCDVPQEFSLEDGLLGRVVKDRRAITLDDVPDGYLTFGSALGRSKPRHLLISPVIADETVNGVLELGFLEEPRQRTLAILERISEAVAMSIRSANYRAHLQNLLEETQRQSEELQTQSEELRVSNEELEEQGRALKESAARLEQQQAELEQTNTQLEEQTQLLESQRDELAKSQSALERQASDLEQASRYKSDFLANMSHELRTPLNSSLILAKLLADNADENLTEEQVKFAKTILASGNDLLHLISDILDLSKIEAGRLEVRPSEVSLRQLVEDVAHGVEPLAEQKNLAFSSQIEPACPQLVFTDRQRLEQILKNLLSNAIKFTEKGQVTIAVSRTPQRRIAFAVTDTGIGIPANQQQLVFEAFRQVDSSAHRRQGGTGLGLSISRELARLLGGEIQLSSQPGSGSTFTVIIPEEFDEAAVAPAPKHIPREPEHSPVPETVPLRPATLPIARQRRMEDDREKLTGEDRVILVVEDDESFARILYDMAHELKFQCLIATTAEEALAVALQFKPSAVVLDVGLPDHSGLSVLDRLKYDSRVRHIPVHVISASDYTAEALALGAVGFMLKPVKRDELLTVLQSLEVKFSQRMRRVLVVEDDPVQLDSLRRLLDSHEVQTVGVASASECLQQLRSETFDCMVLDLTLPDASGYSLLETLSREEMYSFPPVIVYTGRELQPDEEQRLRRYSKSIIIKGAKSPERLLDEVTLFLHQVVAELPPEQQRMIEKARRRDAVLEGRRILVVEDDVRNIFALTSVLEPRGAIVQIARNGREAVEAIDKSLGNPAAAIDLVLMDVMMPEMDGITATSEIRKRPACKRLSIIMLTAKAMKDDQQTCLVAGANDYLAKPLDVEKLLSLIRVWLPR